MDPTDRAIIYELQRNGRIPNNELAARVGLSPSPCLRRVRALEAEGIVRGYRALLDEHAIGCSYRPLVWVTLTAVTRTTLTDFEAAIATVPAIIEAHRMMGQPDYLLHIATPDAMAFEALYIDVLAGLPHVQTLTSQVAMKTVKRSDELPIADAPSSSPA